MKTFVVCVTINFLFVLWQEVDPDAIFPKLFLCELISCSKVPLHPLSPDDIASTDL